MRFLRSKASHNLGETIVKIKPANLFLIVMLFAFSAAAASFLYFFGNSQLEEVYPSFQFFADSNTYIKTYRGDGDEGAIIRVDGNYFGPLIVLNIFQGNNYLVMLFNCFVFGWSVIRIAKSLNLNSFRLALLLMISPLTISNLLSVNKEIFLFPFLAFALDAYLRGSRVLMLLALFVSICVRWQLGIFYLALICIINLSWLVKGRIKTLLLFLVAISFVYLLIQPLIQPILLYVQFSNESYDGEGSGVFERVVEFQNVGLYFLVFPVKAFHLLFGMGFKFDKIFNPADLYNDFFVAGHCAITFIVFSLLVFKRKNILKSDLLFVVVLFLIVFCMTPIFAPRYLYFVFLLGVLMLAGASNDLQQLKPRKRSYPLFERTS